MSGWVSSLAHHVASGKIHAVTRSTLGVLAAPVAVVVLTVSHVDRGQGVSSDTLATALDTYLRPYGESRIFSGAALVAKGGRILLRQAWGMADGGRRIANRPDTRFYIGQVAETFTAAAILLLEERGKLSVSDSIAKFIPGFPNADRITVQALLTRSSRIPSPPTLAGFEQQSRARPSLAAVVRWLATEPGRLPSRPGSYEYSSTDYVLLALVIAQASGESYEAFVTHNIFEPLKMHNTGFHEQSPGPEPASRYVASGVRFAEPAPNVNWSILTGSASAFSTVDDLYTWDRALRDGRILTSSSVSKMTSPERGDRQWRYGWLASEGGRSLTSTVRAPGLGASFERFPVEDVCVVLLSNVMESLTHSTADELADIARGGAHTPVAPRTSVLVPDDVLNRYVGRYEFSSDFFSPVRTVEAVRKGDSLALISDGFPAPDYLAAKDTTTFVDRLYGGIVRFSTNTRGTVTELVWTLRAPYRARRLDGTSGTPSHPGAKPQNGYCLTFDLSTVIQPEPARPCGVPGIVVNLR